MNVTCMCFGYVFWFKTVMSTAMRLNYAGSSLGDKMDTNTARMGRLTFFC